MQVADDSLVSHIYIRIKAILRRDSNERASDFGTRYTCTQVSVIVERSKTKDKTLLQLLKTAVGSGEQVVSDRANIVHVSMNQSLQTTHDEISNAHGWMRSNHSQCQALPSKGMHEVSEAACFQHRALRLDLKVKEKK